MQLSAARSAKARFLCVIVLVGLSREVAAQADERDALIRELRQRNEALEKKLGEKPAPPPPPTAAPRPTAAAPTPAESEQAGAADEGARALERALVREGAFVLPNRVFEIEPRFQYTFRNTQGLNTVLINGVPQAVQQDVRRDDFETSIALRAGLPASMQLDVRLPYVWISQNTATASTVSQTEDTSGWGDVEVNLSKQLAAGRRAGLLGSLFWKSASGHEELGRLSPGSGFHQIQVAVNAVLREDPLVFFLSPSYSWVLKREKNGVEVDPGDSGGVKAGALLAASPETSLRAAFELSRAGRTRIAGQGVPGSDTTLGSLEVGFSKVLTRRTLLDVALAVGLTPDAPDFRLRFAIPVRFGP
jgi:hypothetical protein